MLKLFVSCNNRENKPLDLFYADVKDSYVSKLNYPLRKSNHNLIFLCSQYNSFYKREPAIDNSKNGATRRVRRPARMFWGYRLGWTMSAPRRGHPGNDWLYDLLCKLLCRYHHLHKNSEQFPKQETLDNQLSEEFIQQGIKRFPEGRQGISKEYMEAA